MTQSETNTEDCHVVEDEELAALLESLAETLASLSEIEEGPVGYDLSVDPFQADDVDFTKNSWLLRLAQVQAWLHLDASVAKADITDDPAGALVTFLKSIGQENPGQCYKIIDDVVLLTFAGAEAISSRLDIAQKLAGSFVEALEDLSRKEATAEWDSAWEEEDFGEADPEPIKAKTDNWRINDFAGKASSNRLNLNPTYQRGDVWPKGDSQKLIESILRGIPLPSVIILRPASEKANVVYEVVDGKQRLTAILRFIGKHPAALARVAEADAKHPSVNFKKVFQENYKTFKRLWATHMSESLTAKLEGEYYFPFPLPRSSKGLRGELAPLAGKYFHEIRDAEIQVGDGKQTVEDVFEGPGEYKIPLIEYLDAKPRQIHDVFHLYNKQGKHLNAEEIRNAVYHDLDLVKLLLVTAGDNPDIAKLAGFVAQEQKDSVAEIAGFLDDYRFGTSRYKRTKILSWLVALLMSPSVDEDGLVIRSTAKQINSLLDAIRNAPPERPHPLADRHRLRRLVDDLHRCLDVHSACDGWTKKFRDDKDGTKWQELQLIASLVGVFLICLVHKDADELLDDRRDALLDFTARHPRPRKTQNKTQWAYIGEVTLGMLELLEIDPESVEATLTARYGVNCLPTLRAARAHYVAGA
jgi:hypothetical protein